MRDHISRQDHSLNTLNKMSLSFYLYLNRRQYRTTFLHIAVVLDSMYHSKYIYI